MEWTSSGWEFCYFYCRYVYLCSNSCVTANNIFFCSKLILSTVLFSAELCNYCCEHTPYRYFASIDLFCVEYMERNSYITAFIIHPKKQHGIALIKSLRAICLFHTVLTQNRTVISLAYNTTNTKVLAAVSFASSMQIHFKLSRNLSFVKFCLQLFFLSSTICFASSSND